MVKIELITGCICDWNNNDRLTGKDIIIQFYIYPFHTLSIALY